MSVVLLVHILKQLGFLTS